MLKIINDLLNGDELTFNRNDGLYTMNKWNFKKESYNIKTVTGIILISCGIVEIDSGNTETNETHYIISYPGYNYNKLKNIDDLIIKLSNRDYVINSNLFDLIETLKQIKIIETRKHKINKILNNG